MTPNLQIIYDYTLAKYGQTIGVTKCRKISGKQTYSQHSWSNACDIYTTSHALQDEIAADLELMYGNEIRNILTWRYNSAHWNHVHVDMWPKGWLTPPCAGGALRIKYKNGMVTTGQPFPSTIWTKEEDMAILTDAEQVKLQHFLLELEDVGSNVEFVRTLIPWYRLWRTKAPTTFVEINEGVAIVRDNTTP